MHQFVVLCEIGPSLNQSFIVPILFFLKVYNFLPSISASIGGFTPQRYIWRIAVALHITPRVLYAFLYYNWHGQDSHNWSANSNYRALCRTNLGLSLAELLCLIGLTYVSSNEDYGKYQDLENNVQLPETGIYDIQVCIQVRIQVHEPLSYFGSHTDEIISEAIPTPRGACNPATASYIRL